MTIAQQLVPKQLLEMSSSRVNVLKSNLNSPFMQSAYFYISCRLALFGDCSKTQESQSEMKVGICPGMALFEIGNQRVDLQVICTKLVQNFLQNMGTFFIRPLFSLQIGWSYKRETTVQNKIKNVCLFQEPKEEEEPTTGFATVSFEQEPDTEVYGEVIYLPQCLANFQGASLVVIIWQLDL